MSPEYVAEGFYRLVTQCDSGAVMAVMPGIYFIFPDTSSTYIFGLVLLAKLCQRITGGVSLVNTNHLLAILSLIIFLFLYLVTLIF